MLYNNSYKGYFILFLVGLFGFGSKKSSAPLEERAKKFGISIVEKAGLSQEFDYTSLAVKGAGDSKTEAENRLLENARGLNMRYLSDLVYYGKNRPSGRLEIVEAKGYVPGPKSRSGTRGEMM